MEQLGEGTRDKFFSFTPSESYTTHPEVIGKRWCFYQIHRAEKSVRFIFRNSIFHLFIYSFRFYHRNNSSRQPLRSWSLATPASGEQVESGRSSNRYKEVTFSYGIRMCFSYFEILLDCETGPRIELKSALLSLAVWLCVCVCALLHKRMLSVKLVNCEKNI